MKPARPAARILLVDGDGRLLLFRFTAPDGRPPFWCTPGGALDPGESYPEAARRELLEETGIDADPGPEIDARTVEFRTVEGVDVVADERWFRVDVPAHEVVATGHTELERRVMRSWRWFSRADLAAETEAVYPDDLATLLDTTVPNHAR